MTLLFIEDWWNPLTNAEKIYWAIALIFSVLFLLQFIVSLIGLDFDADGDIEAGNTFSATDAPLDPGFSVLSVRGLIAFFTFFGWTGALVLKTGAAVWLAITLSFSAGLAAMLIVAYLMYQFYKMSESGTVQLRNAIYKNGEVYIPIPAYKNGFGKVHIRINGTLKEIEAVTDGDAIPTGTSIKVVEVLDNEVLLVEALNINIP